MQEKNYQNAKFSARLKEAIQASGLTQRELASKTGISEVSISRYVKGSQRPTRAALFMLASHLNITTSYLLGDDADEQSVADAIQDDNSLPETHDNWKQRALAAEQKLQHLETIIHELFTFAKIK